MSIIGEKIRNVNAASTMSEDERMYANTLVVSNTVSVITAVMQAVSGGKLASLDSATDLSALPDLVALKVQARLTAIIAGGKVK